MPFELMTGEERVHLINTQQLYEELRARELVLTSHGGSMSFVAVAGREYLQKSAQRRGLRQRKSLGPRSPETEAIYDAFYVAKREAESRLNGIRTALQRQARINVGFGLGRMPALPATVLRILDRNNLLGNGCIVLGTNALFAYEGLLGAKASANVLATDDLDIMVDTRRRLSLGGDASSDTLASLLKTADPSFERLTSRRYAMTNRAGYAVELIAATEAPPWNKPKHPLAPEDLQPAQIEHLRCLLQAPKVRGIGIDEQGLPVPLSTVHPVPFSVYKIWMSEQPSRAPAKRRRDEAQARAVIELCRKSGYVEDFEPMTMSMPREMRDVAMRAELFSSGSDSGYDLGRLGL